MSSFAVAGRKFSTMPSAKFASDRGRPGRRVGRQRPRSRQHRKMMADIWVTGPLTGLVNNAGANFLAPTETLSPRGYEAIRSTIMDGSFYAAQACGQTLDRRGSPGVIISNLVTWVWTGSAYVVPAAMAKAAVHAMTMSLAVEWGPKGHSRQCDRARSVSDRKCLGQAQSARGNRRGRHASRRGAAAPIRQDG